MPDDKPKLLLADLQITRRQVIASKLSAFYHVSDFAVLPNALRHARLNPTDVILIAEDAGRKEDFSFLKAIRREPMFSTLPIIVSLAGDSHEKYELAMRAGATAALPEPYTLSRLIQTISTGLNQAMEKSWERLPELQAAALQNSVAMFNKISDQIATGDPIVFSDVKEACQPLVAAVNSSEIKHVLERVRAHDNYTYVHSLRVGVFLSLFGSGIGLATEDLGVLMTGGLLHDLGKMEVPLLILNKPGRLDVEEYKIVKGHVAATMRILEKSPQMHRGVMVIAGHHHEKLDGTGYPFGLSGKKLNDLARMAAIADVFSALTDRRVYKPAMEPEKAFQIMAEEMTSHFDTVILTRFRQLLLDTKVSWSGP